jgi:hypothetical protein
MRAASYALRMTGRPVAAHTADETVETAPRYSSTTWVKGEAAV